MKTYQNKGQFKRRVRYWAQKLDVEVCVISIRSMKNKWASYTQNSSLLIFNVELLNIDKELVDYVIVHELVHSIAPNHGKLWKSLMKAHLGDYQLLEVRLSKRSS